MKTIQIYSSLLLLLFTVWSNAQTDAVTISPDGYVGIGTVLPETPLHLNSKADNTVFTFTNTSPEFKNNASIALKNYTSDDRALQFLNANTSARADTKSFTFLNNATTEIITMLNGGNVGIGTSNPTQKLHINGSIQTNTAFIGHGGWDANHATFSYKGFGNQSKHYALLHRVDGSTFINASVGQSIHFRLGNVDQMVMNKDGNFGIGTTTPTQGKLVVRGTGNHQTNVTYGYLNNDKGNTTGVYAGTVLYSIYATGRIASTEFNAYSDLRIKNNIALSNAAHDLKTLSQIRITDYTLIDTITKGNQTHKKVIAQQLKEVYPQSVTDDITEVIPNIYQLSTLKDGWIKILPKDLIVGDTVKLIFSDKETLVDVLEVKENAIKVAADREGQVFVYGKQVNDFHAVDYEAVAMLNVSATQALLQRIETLESEKKTLSRKQQQLEDKLTASVSRIEKLEHLFNNLK